RLGGDGALLPRGGPPVPLTAARWLYSGSTGAKPPCCGLPRRTPLVSPAIRSSRPCRTCHDREHTPVVAGTPMAPPAPVSSFVGRRRELTALTALVERHRLVSLVGSGGCGKTRLVSE